MNLLKKCLLLLACSPALPVSLPAQYLKFSWSEQPALHTISNKEFQKASAINILDDEQYEIVPVKNEAPITRTRVHRIIRINDEKGLESFNKFKVAFSEKRPLKQIKARTITSKGEVIELTANQFKETKEEDGTMTKLFALEGVDVGSEVEYMYEQDGDVLTAGFDYMQASIPMVLSRIEIIAPPHLVYEMKGYNNVKTQSDTVIGDYRCVWAVTENLPGLEEEEYGSYLNHLARVEYVLAYNMDTRGRGIRLYPWEKVAENLYAASNQYNESQLKDGRKWLNDQKDFKPLSDPEDKIRWIEQYIKTNIQQEKYLPVDNADALSFILKNKVTTEQGIRNFFYWLLRSAGIDFSIGYTTNRFERPLDFSFPNYENLKECILYFPQSKKYLAPNEPYFRYPWIPSTWCGNTALMTGIVKMGDVVKARPEKVVLPETKAEENFHNHDIRLSFNTGMDSAIIKLTNTFGGYNALNFVPVFSLLEGEKRDEAAREILRLGEKEEKFGAITYANNDFISFAAGKPLTVSAVLYATNLLERAGPKYIVKIGELIGRQAELYEEKPRQFDIDIPNPHHYIRKIHMDIPQGFTVRNTEKLKMNVVTAFEGKEICLFTSDFTMNDQSLDITVYEVYHQSHTPIAAFPDYKKVINAAADFNKIALVLEKK